MKARLFVTVFAILSLVFSCTTRGKQIVSDSDNSGERIKFKEYKIINGVTYHLLEVDSVEYLFQYRGGAVRLGTVKK